MYHVNISGEAMDQVKKATGTARTSFWFNTEEQRTAFIKMIDAQIGDKKPTLWFSNGIVAMMLPIIFIMFEYLGFQYTVTDHGHYGQDVNDLVAQWQNGDKSSPEYWEKRIRESNNVNNKFTVNGIGIAKLRITRVNSDYQTADFDKPHDAFKEPPPDKESVTGFNKETGYTYVTYNANLNEYVGENGVEEIHYWYYLPIGMHLPVPTKARPPIPTLRRIPMRPFFETLSQLEFGKTLDDLGEHQHNLIEALREHGGKGSVTLKLNYSPDGSGQIIITPEVKSTLPTAARGRSIFFVTADGELSRDNPQQAPLDLGSRDLNGGNSQEQNNV